MQLIENKICSTLLTCLAGISIAFIPGLNHGGQLPILCLFLIALIMLFNREVWEQTQNRFFLILVFIFVAALPLAINSQDGEALDVPSRYLIAAIIFLALFRIRLNYEIVFKFTIISVLIALITAMSETSDRLGLGIGILESGAILCTMLFILIALGVYSKNLYFRIVLAAAGIASCYLLILTGARGAWLALISTSLLISYFTFGQYHKLKFLGVLLILPCLLSVAYLTIPMVEHRTNAIITDFEKLDKNASTSVGIRLMLWELAVEGYLQSPVYGLSYKENAELRTKYIDKYSTELSGSHDGKASSHSDIFNVMIKHGSIGIIALFLLYLVPLYHFIKKYKINDPTIRMYAFIGIALVSSMFFSGLTEAILMHSSVATFYATVLVFLYHAIRQEEEPIYKTQGT